MSQKRNLLISFSGGETSAYMTWWLLTHYRDNFNEVAVVFANTGQEREETLEFVEKCDRHFGFGVVWVEAQVHHNEKKAPTHRIVNFNAADRDGIPFEEAIKKYGIPNLSFKHCSNNLKKYPIQSYAKTELGWEPSTKYLTAIGIRRDEVDRVSPKAAELGLFYPLVKIEPMTKPDINAWWQKQPFRLELKGYQGNCKWCWKKSNRKLFTIMSEDPEAFDFPRRMEQLYSTVGPEFSKETLPQGYRRTFFTGNKSTDDLVKEYEQRKATFTPATDDAQNYFMWDLELDTGGGCGDSCEVFTDEE
jgi:hypothetical protein